MNHPKRKSSPDILSNDDVLYIWTILPDLGADIRKNRRGKTRCEIIMFPVDVLQTSTCKAKSTDVRHILFEHRFYMFFFFFLSCVCRVLTMFLPCSRILSLTQTTLRVAQDSCDFALTGDIKPEELPDSAREVRAMNTFDSLSGNIWEWRWDL